MAPSLTRHDEGKDDEVEIQPEAIAEVTDEEVRLVEEVSEE